MSDEVSSATSALPPVGSVLLEKARNILERHKLEITKSWLNNLIGQIEDLDALESFPTQNSIRMSTGLISGLAAALHNQATLEQFKPGGMYYEQAAALGLLQKDESGSLEALCRSLDALECAIWDQLCSEMRQQDREILGLTRVLRQGLQLVMTAAADAYHQQSIVELNRIAHTDPLTELGNRRFFEQELARHVELYKRYRHPFALLLLDFDNLKLHNDTHGHAAGDAALQHLANIMRSNVRDVDIPCRFGGDEFTILLPEAGKEAAVAAGHRIANTVAKTPLKVERTLVSLRISFGVSACPEDGTEPEILLEKADAGLYSAKEQKVGQAD